MKTRTILLIIGGVVTLGILGYVLLSNKQSTTVVGDGSGIGSGSKYTGIASIISAGSQGLNDVMKTVGGWFSSDDHAVDNEQSNVAGDNPV